MNTPNAYEAFAPVTRLKAGILYCLPIIAAIVIAPIALCCVVLVCLFNLCRLLMPPLLNTVRSLFAAPAIRVMKHFKPDWNPRYTTRREVNILCDLVQHTTGAIVELGCNEGATLTEMAQYAQLRKVIGVDFSGNNSMSPAQRSEMPKPERIGIRAKCWATVEIIDCDSRKVEPLLVERGPIGLMFIDGDHSEAGVKADTEMALRLVNGVIVWHDYSPNAPAWVKVREVLDQWPHLHVSTFPGTQLAMAVTGTVQPKQHEEPMWE